MSAVQPPSERHTLWKLLLCLAIILALGGAISPVLYWLGKGVLKSLHESGFASYEQQKDVWLWAEIARADFPRFFNRAILVAAVIVLPLAIKRLGFQRAHLPTLKPGWGDGLHFFVGFVIAALLLLELGYVLASRGVYLWRTDARWFNFLPALIPALSVSLIEEILFRGFIIGLFLQTMRPGMAAFWTAFIFALVHFLKPPEGLMHHDSPVGPWTGFWLIGQIFASFGHMEFFLAEFCTLFAVGWALGRARLITHGVWLSIGLHAGWVFGLKYFSAVTKGSRPLRDGDYLPWIGENLRIGLVPLLVVVLTGWFVGEVARSTSRNPKPQKQRRIEPASQ
jgi:uncharacterized protein